MSALTQDQSSVLDLAIKLASHLAVLGNVLATRFACSGHAAWSRANVCHLDGLIWKYPQGLEGRVKFI